MANRAIGVLTKNQGTINRLLLPSKKPFSSLQLGLGFGPFEKVSNLDDALYWFDEMLQTRPLPSSFNFTRLLDFVTKIKQFSRSIDCFKQMLAVDVPVNKHTASIVIKCYSRLHQTEHGFTVLCCCLKQGVVPGTWTYNTLINGFILEDKTHEAERLFKKLIRNQLCEPNLVTYNTMIRGLCKIGENLTAIGLVRLMDGRGCKPNLDTYNIIVHSLCKDLMIDDAFKLFKGMISHKSVAPDVVTYNSLIDALCRSGRWDEVSRMIKQMEDETISPDMKTFNAIVDALCKEGNIKEAEIVIDIMYEKFDKHIDTVTVNSLIKGHCLRGEMTRARVHFDRLRGYNRNVDTYNIMLYGYCRDLKKREAFLFYNDLLAPGVKPKPNLVAHSIVEMGRMLRAIVAESGGMQSKVGFSRNHPYMLLLQPEAGSGNSYEDALALFRFMEGIGSKLNSHIEVYNVLIDGAIKCGKIDTARRLHHELCVKGLQPDPVTCALMLTLFCERDVLKALSEMEKSPDCQYFLDDNVISFHDVLQRGILQRGVV